MSKEIEPATFRLVLQCLYQMRHSRKLTNGTAGEEVRKIDHGYYLNFRGSQFRKWGGGEFFRTSLFIHTPFPHSYSNFFICPSPTQ
jgi:hypothetical protein